MDFPIAVIYRNNSSLQDTTESTTPCAGDELSHNKKVVSENQTNSLPSTGVSNDAFEIEAATDVVINVSDVSNISQDDINTDDPTLGDRTIPPCTCGDNSLRKKKSNRITMKSTKEFFRSISSNSVNVLELMRDPTLTTEKAVLERYKEKAELRRSISSTTDSRVNAMFKQLEFARGADPYIFRADPGSFVIDFNDICGIDAEEPPPSYSSLASIFMKDEPPKYEVVTGKKLAMDLIENKVCINSLIVFIVLKQFLRMFFRDSFVEEHVTF